MNAPTKVKLDEEFLTLQEFVSTARRNLPPGPWN